jgi:tight adherence protein B
MLARLELQLEIARIEIPAMQVVLFTVAATLFMVIVLALLSPILAVLGLLTPLVTRSLVAFKLRKLREEFAEQLPPNLQVLASALRVGHSFIGALTVVVENAHEPSQGELQRALTDEQLGVPVDEAIRRVAVRMASRDLEQVALLAELQRTAGGNAAEVLDTVVETLRQRADLRRLIRTLTVQGRMARWILTSLPIVAGALLWLLQGPLMKPLFTTGAGQVLLVVATLMVVAGSLIIQKIVDIDV